MLPSEWSLTGASLPCSKNLDACQGNTLAYFDSTSDSKKKVCSKLQNFFSLPLMLQATDMESVHGQLGRLVQPCLGLGCRAGCKLLHFGRYSPYLKILDKCKKSLPRANSLAYFTSASEPKKKVCLKLQNFFFITDTPGKT